MIEIEFIGTGGQGSVVAAKLLADAGVKAGFSSQSFASYGSQRRGGEVESYVRLGEGVILVHSKVYQPDYLVLMDQSLVKYAQRVKAIKKGATVLVNTSKQSDELSTLTDCTLVAIDADRIAAERRLTLPSGMPIINTAVLGAVWGLLPSLSIDPLEEALRDGKLPAIEKNIGAAREAYRMVKEGRTGYAQEVGALAAKTAGERFPEYCNLLSPCEAACPAGEPIERTAYFIQNGDFAAALESIKAENPFPGICGRVCFHPCEDKCNRIQFDEGIATNPLERAAFDYGVEFARAREKRPATGKKIAVIGSGPAGATCAYYLALLGHGVSVFEAEPVAGGIPRFAIPEYRLPKKVVDRELRDITNLGIEIKLNARVGKDIAFDSLRRRYDACFIAAGAHHPTSLGIPGEDTAGVLTGIKFLKSVAFGEKIDLGPKVVVVGGGNTAVDSARTAIRLGAREVTIAYRRSAEEMPAFKEEAEAARAEGVRMEYLAMPVRVHAKEGHVSGLECIRAKLGTKEADGRRRPEPIQGSNFTIVADTVVTALGESVEAPFPEGAIEMAGPVIRVDELGRTSLAGVYAGGDAVSTSRSVVQAIASGKKAAVGIDLFLMGDNHQATTRLFKTNGEGVSMRRYLAGDFSANPSAVVTYQDLNVVHFTKAPRTEPAELSVAKRVSRFAEVNRGFTRADARAEAGRCFHCGRCTLCEICYISCPDIAISLNSDGQSFAVNKVTCKSCGICVHECPRHAMRWEGVPL